MKKLLLLISLMAFAITSQAQKLDFWLDAGLKVQYGGSPLRQVPKSEVN